MFSVVGYDICFRFYAHIGGGNGNVYSLILRMSGNFNSLDPGSDDFVVGGFYRCDQLGKDVLITGIHSLNCKLIAFCISAAQSFDNLQGNRQIRICPSKNGCKHRIAVHFGVTASLAGFHAPCNKGISCFLFRNWYGLYAAAVFHQLCGQEAPIRVLKPDGVSIRSIDSTDGDILLDGVIDALPTAESVTYAGRCRRRNRVGVVFDALLGQCRVVPIEESHGDIWHDSDHDRRNTFRAFSQKVYGSDSHTVFSGLFSR